MEIWLKINEKFQVSNQGQIRRIKDLKIMKPWSTGIGYQKIQVGKDRERYRVHRLVAEAWCLRPNDEYLVVHHLNGNRSDNRAINLQWITQSENVRLGKLGNPPLLW
jgi:hypothetical protein